MSTLEDLKTLLDGSQGEAIDVPHPNQHKKIETTPMTNWRRSELPSDFEKNQLGALLYVEDADREDFGRPKTYITGQIVRQVVLDEYNEPVGDPDYALMTKVSNPELRNKDVASGKIRPFGCREQRKRFPAVFAELEAKLARDGEDLPIAFLDEVPPHVVQILIAKGVKTVQAFASYQKKDLDALRDTLKAHKLHARVNFVEKYRDQAREKIGLTSTPAKAA